MKPGDKVIRLEDDYSEVKKDNVYTVRFISSKNNDITLKEVNGVYDVRKFRVIEEETLKLNFYV